MWHSSQLARLLVAMCVGSIAGAALVVLPFTIVAHITAGAELLLYPGNPYVARFQLFVGTLVIFTHFLLCFTLPAALVIGIPSFYLLKRLLKWWAVALLGTIGGLAVGALLKAGIPSVREAEAFVVIGLVSALSAFAVLLRVLLRSSLSPLVVGAALVAAGYYLLNFFALLGEDVSFPG